MEEPRIAPYFNREDRISKLPDCLIHYIMSFNDTKYAVQTSVLSKRWMHIWKSLPFLNFNRNSFSADKKDSFIMFVYMVLFLRQDIDIQRFYVRWLNSAYDQSVIMNVNRWSLAAVKYNVKHFHILITQCPAYEISHHLLNCKSLRGLVIQLFGNALYADVILPRSVNLPQLKVLVLHGLSISDVESSRRLFSSCPVLETLLVSNCDIQTDNQRNFIVDSVSLKKFGYRCWYRHLFPQNDTMAKIIKLRAPNLQAFYCRSFLPQDYSLEICSLISSSNLVYLVLDMWSTRGCFQAIANLLKISPNITRLSLESKESNLADVGNDWEEGLPVPGMLPHLKFVQIREVKGRDAELQLLRFLLKNATVLEEVALFFRSRVGSHDRVRQVKRFRDKLRALPTASSSIKLMLF